MRVLIVRVGAMGDVLHGLPAVAALRERLGPCFIGWAVEPKWKALLEGQCLETPHKIHLVPTREWKKRPLSLDTLRSIAALRRELVAEQYDFCVDLQGSIRSAVIGWMAETRRFVGPEEPREWLAQLLYDERVPVEAEHVIWQACELLEPCIGDRALGPSLARVPVNAEAENWAEQLLPTLNIGPLGFVLLAPTAGWGAKEWPAEKFTQLAKRLASAGYRVLINGGSSADEAMLQQMAEASGAAVIESDVAQLIALTRRAKLVVGGDSGPVHLAAALGIGVVALFGPTDPARNGPYFVGARTRVLHHPSSQLSFKRTAETEAGLAKITVEEVEAAALDLLREGTENG